MCVFMAGTSTEQPYARHRQVGWEVPEQQPPGQRGTCRTNVGHQTPKLITSAPSLVSNPQPSHFAGQVLTQALVQTLENQSNYDSERPMGEGHSAIQAGLHYGGDPHQGEGRCPPQGPSLILTRERSVIKLLNKETSRVFL